MITKLIFIYECVLNKNYVFCIATWKKYSSWQLKTAYWSISLLVNVWKCSSYRRVKVSTSLKKNLNQSSAELKFTLHQSKLFPKPFFCWAKLVSKPVLSRSSAELSLLKLKIRNIQLINNPTYSSTKRGKILLRKFPQAVEGVGDDGGTTRQIKGFVIL